MKDVLVGIIFLWILWKIFGGRTVIHKYHFTQNQHHHSYDKSREGEVKVEKPAPEKTKKIDDSGEYVDYEEIK